MKFKNKKLLIYRIAVFTVCVFTLFGMDFFNIGEAGFKTYSGGAGLPEMQFGCDPDRLYHIIGRLGSEGRLFYLRSLLYDFIFIAGFALTQAELMKIFLGKGLINGKWRYAVSLSYLRGFFDIMENILIITILTHYPTGLYLLAELACLSTTLKFIILALWVMAALIAVVMNMLMKKDKGSIY